jgi:hypothetical protein
MVLFHVLQSSVIVDLLHSRVKIPLPGALSLHRPARTHRFKSLFKIQTVSSDRNTESLGQICANDVQGFRRVLPSGSP